MQVAKRRAVAAYPPRGADRDDSQPTRKGIRRDKSKRSLLKEAEDKKFAVRRSKVMLKVDDGSTTGDPYDDLESDEEQDKSRIGNVPLEWYEDFEHIGYDVDGKPVAKTLDVSAISQLLSSADDPDYWRKIPDFKNQRLIQLSDTDLEIIRRVRNHMYPNPTFDPHGRDSHVEFDHEDYMHPVSAPTPAKRSFVPSKHEAIKINRLIRAIRAGKLKPPPLPAPDVFDLWGSSIFEDTTVAAGRLKGPPPLFAPRVPLPVHAESYNPPREYLFDDQELEEWEEADPEDREFNFIPKAHDALRKVPRYKKSTLERFERCLDLYLCPRTVRRQWNLDPESLLPELPSTRDLRPFPSKIILDFQFYDQSMVMAMSVTADGAYLAVGTKCGKLAVYDVATTRGMWTFQLAAPVTAVEFHPSLPILAFSLEEHLYIALIDLPSYRAVPDTTGSTQDADGTAGTDSEEDSDASEDDEDGGAPVKTKSKKVALSTELQNALITENKGNHWQVARKLMAPSAAAHSNWTDLSRLKSSAENGTAGIEENTDSVAEFVVRKQGIVRAFKIKHDAAIGNISWHHRGLFVATACPYTGVPSQQCAIHSIARRATLRPLRKGGGRRVIAAAFHPTEQHFFVLYASTLKIFDLHAKKHVGAPEKKKQTLIGSTVRKLTGFDGANSFSIHKHGEHVIVGSDQQKLYWFDLELKQTPYKIITHHEKAIKDVGFHRNLPLTYSASTDGTARLLHTRVYNDLVTNPVIIPLNVLRLQEDTISKTYLTQAKKLGDAPPLTKTLQQHSITCCVWHPYQPWLFCASSTGNITLWA